ncbi:MAG: apolipoprotein N-acyltransferase [Acidobacteria bacterium]|nr:apolipoprotein N-acyltransferase [Acidobacteriota bacterium]
MALAPLIASVVGLRSSTLAPRSSADASAAARALFPARVRQRPASPHGRALRLGLVTGLVYFAGTLYWITDVMVAYGDLNRVVGVLLNGLLVAYLALYPAMFAWMLSIVTRAIGLKALWLVPLLWVATELGRARLFGGFPWVLLGYSQTPILPIAQLASLFGVYGVSGLVALVNAALFIALIARGRRRVVAGVVASVAVFGTAAWGSWRITRNDLHRDGTPIIVGLVQGNIAQEDKWNSALADRILTTYLRMSREAASRGARFIIWPESSTPFYFEEDALGAGAIRNLARQTGAYVLVGSDQIQRGSQALYYNAAFLLKPDGQLADVYRKIHLVPFGEYVPLKRLLFFAAPLVESVSDFSAGDIPTVLPIDGHWASTAICYEVVYPDLINRFVNAGSELLTTITNDAWYGRSSAPHQHFQQASMRSIEQGRYLARAANTGISGIVDPYGRVIAKSELFEPALIVGEVRFREGRTIYGITGDLFAYLSAAASIAAVAAALSGRRLARRSSGLPDWIRPRRA